MWLGVSSEKAEVSPEGSMLTVTKVPLRVVPLPAVVSVSAVLPVGGGVSTVASGVADSVALAVDKASAKVVDLVMYDLMSEGSGKADVPEVDKAFTPVGL